MGRARYRQLNSDPTVGFALQTESLSNGWGPACGELVIEITPWDCLAGRKVRRQLCGEHQLFFTNRRACCKSKLPVFFGPAWGLGVSPAVLQLSSEQRSSPKFILQLFVNLEPVPFLGVAK